MQKIQKGKVGTLLLQVLAHGMCNKLASILNVKAEKLGIDRIHIEHNKLEDLKPS